MQKSDWISIAAFIYLAIPLQIFLLTHLKFWLGIPLFILISFIIVKVVRYYHRQQISFIFSRHELLLSIFIIILWVLLSGIGGYAFQNSDHAYRNAILRDLIQYKWPVIYHQNDVAYGLVYYIGYWLPSALIGKWFGWETANLSLFIWTLVGVTLTLMLIKKRLGTSLIFCTLLLIFFSGMDFLGVMLIKLYGYRGYPFLWPPISHLEWWSGFFQYSSFTTQLFWVFNQALPSWLIMALIMNQTNGYYLFFLWSLALFYCPLPAFGMLPYIFLSIPWKYQNITTLFSHKKTIKEHNHWSIPIIDLRSIVSIENFLGGATIFILSSFYYYSNQFASQFTVTNFNSQKMLMYTLVIIFEFLIYILIMIYKQKNNLWLIYTGVILVLSPFFALGKDINLSLRISIPALFTLLIMTGDFIKKNRHHMIKFSVLIIFLLIGAITPFYEISRSIYRTFRYYREPIIQVETHELIKQKPVHFPADFPPPEFYNPNFLIANSFQTLTYFDLSTATNFVSRTDNSLFFRWISR